MEIFWSKKLVDETKKEIYPIFEESKCVAKIAADLKNYGNEIGKAIFVVKKEYDVRKQIEKQKIRPDVVIFLAQEQPSYETEKKAEIVMSVDEICKKKRAVPEFTGAQERLRHLLGTARDDIAALFQDRVGNPKSVSHFRGFICFFLWVFIGFCGFVWVFLGINEICGFSLVFVGFRGFP
jgi:hypothetical protein